MWHSVLMSLGLSTIMALVGIDHRDEAEDEIVCDHGLHDVYVEFGCAELDLDAFPLQTPTREADGTA